MIKEETGKFSIDKINFRHEFIKQLIKFFELGIFHVFAPVEVNGEEREIRMSININQKQLDNYLQRMNKEFDTYYYEIIKMEQIEKIMIESFANIFLENFFYAII